jgi:sugar lactone lactonase YvrE
VAVAVLDDGTVAALDRDEGTVVLFSDRGRYLRTLGGGRGVGELGFRRPEGLVVDEKGRLWVVDTGNHRLVVVDTEGAQIAAYGSLGSSRDRFHGPRDVSFGGGLAYVADTGNERVQVLRASDGVLLDSWSSRTGGRKGYLRKPIAVAYTDRQSGGLWVLNEEAGRRLEFFDLDGKWERSLDVPDAVPDEVELVDVVLEPGLYRMFLTDASGGRMVILNRRGELQEVLEPDDGVLSPRGIAVTRKLDIYTADVSGRRVLHFSTR